MHSHSAIHSPHSFHEPSSCTIIALAHPSSCSLSSVPTARLLACLPAGFPTFLRRLTKQSPTFAPADLPPIPPARRAGRRPRGPAACGPSGGAPPQEDPRPREWHHPKAGKFRVKRLGFIRHWIGSVPWRGTTRMSVVSVCARRTPLLVEPTRSSDEGMSQRIAGKGLGCIVFLLPPPLSPAGAPVRACEAGKPSCRPG